MRLIETIAREIFKAVPKFCRLVLGHLLVDATLHKLLAYVLFLLRSLTSSLLCEQLTQQVALV